MNPRAILLVLTALVLGAVLWGPGLWPGSGGGSTTVAPPASVGVTGTDPTDGVDPDSGLPWVAVDQLPPEAAETLDLIDAGGPFPHDEDDGVFANREGLLPDRGLGYYREYTVDTPGSQDRGARRIVTGSAGEYYWTEDHYQSFERISR